MKTYIQIGTNSGDDDFKKRCGLLEEKSRIVLVEPHVKLNNYIERNYQEISEKHEVIIVNKAIVPQEGLKSIYIYFTEYEEWLSSAINRRSYDRFASKINVDAITINSLLRELNIEEVEELHIDAEGLDYEILLSIDSAINIKMITCEIWPYDNDDKNNVYQTGPSLLHKIEERFSGYQISNVVIGDMPSLMFLKN